MTSKIRSKQLYDVINATYSKSDFEEILKTFSEVYLIKRENPSSIRRRSFFYLLTMTTIKTSDTWCTLDTKVCFLQYANTEVDCEVEMQKKLTVPKMGSYSVQNLKEFL